MLISFSKILVAVYTFLLLACAQTVDAVTYQIELREGSLAPWSFLGGSITTDGTIGSISPLNFESWAFSFLSPAGESKISSENGGAYQKTETFTSPYYPLPQTPPLLTATADQLILSPGGGNLDLIFSTQDIFSDDFRGKAVVFSVSHLGVAGSLIDNDVNSSDPYHPLNIDPRFIPGIEVNPNRTALVSFPSAPFVIGSVALVPEPTSCLLFQTVLSIYFIVNSRSHSELAGSVGAAIA